MALPCLSAFKTFIFAMSFPCLVNTRVLTLCRRTNSALKIDVVVDEKKNRVQVRHKNELLKVDKIETGRRVVYSFWLLWPDWGWKKMIFRGKNVLEESNGKDFIDFWSYCKEYIEVDTWSHCKISEGRLFIIAVYQEMRTIPINLVSLRTQVVEPLLHEKYRVSLVFCFRWTGQQPFAMKIFFDELSRQNLTQYMVRFQFNSPVEEQSIVDILFQSMTGFNPPNPDNPPKPLFVQFSQRHMTARVVRELLSCNKSQFAPFRAFVAFVRSDMYFGNIQMPKLLQMMSRSTGHVMWVPKYDSYNNYNDRFAIYTSNAFIFYADNLLARTKEFLKMNATVFGENFHGYVTRSNKQLNVVSIAMCYGVSRLIGCSWTKYGREECKDMGESIINFQLDYAFCSKLIAHTSHVHQPALDVHGFDV